MVELYTKLGIRVNGPTSFHAKYVCIITGLWERSFTIYTEGTILSLEKTLVPILAIRGYVWITEFSRLLPLSHIYGTTVTMRRSIS